MGYITGIGGLFFRSDNPAALSAWYAKHLGISEVPKDYDTPVWEQQAGPTVFAPFPRDTDYFGNKNQNFMLNLRVSDLKALAQVLEGAGVEVTLDPQQYPNGKFARIYDPEGNPVELWEPARGE